MKRILALALVLLMVCACALTACGDTKDAGKEIAVVTDVGQLMDGGFNQGTYEGAKAYAEKNGKTYQYYQPANGADATDNDRIAAMRLAVTNGAKVVVAPGFLQQAAMATVAAENPDVKFVFVDGWAFGQANVTAIVYKEQESGYMAGYAAVKDGYTKLGGTFGGGGSNPACNRYAYGYAQGAADAAKELGKTVDVKISFKYGDGFSASPELQSQISSWYADGIEVVFACGGSMFQSVKSAAEETQNGKIIGVDVDQAPLSDRVITSAVKGLAVSVEKILGEIYDGKWAELSDSASNLGATDDATGIPANFDRFTTFNQADYDALFAKVKSGEIAINAEVANNCNDADWWANAFAGNTAINITLEK